MKLIVDIPDNIYDAIKKTQTLVSGQRSGKTFLQILVNSVENGTPFDSVIEDIKAEIGARVFDIQATSDRYFDGVDDVMDIVDEIIDKHIGKAESEDI